MMNCISLLLLSSIMAMPVIARCARPDFDFNGYKYPILYERECISYTGTVRDISSFQPLFGKERRVVNFGKPELNGAGRICFSMPGEYYIEVNNEAFLKVLVLSRDEAWSSSVTRLFDFVSANLLFANVPEESSACTSNPQEYIEKWFQSEQPGRLLCGPTHTFFRNIIADRLKLPTRIVTFPGVYRWNGRIYKSSHNIPEVYIPDLGKWVLFDINYGFFVKWMDALELADYFHSNSSGDSGMTIVEEMAHLNVYADGPTIYWTANNLAETKDKYAEREVSRIPTAYLWRDAFRFYFSGAAYWGIDTKWAMPTGTEFLPGEYLFANLHEDPELKKTAVEWIRSFGVEPTVLTPDDLRKLLDEGHAGIIAARKWEAGRPAR